jgi:hypothetical protein
MEAPEDDTCRFLFSSRAHDKTHTDIMNVLMMGNLLYYKAAHPIVG